MKVLIIGGTGVFGSRLARRLIASGHDVVIASRTLKSGQAAATKLGAHWVKCDLSGDVGTTLRQVSPDIVVDAAGPFQSYKKASYGLAKAAIKHGIGYLDLSDDAQFTSGISQLNAQAKAAGVAVLSGVSSVPTLSCAITDDLRADLAEITLIETAILPGNRAPRGMSVMRAILLQIGEPLRMWRGNRWRQAPAWSGQKTHRLGDHLTRKAAFIGAPDLTLFPAHFNARSVLFRAGLELRIFQQSLKLLSWLRSKSLVPNIGLFTPLFHAVAKTLEPFGTDQGGMSVRVAGRRSDESPLERHWWVVIASGGGPDVPTLAAEALINRWSAAPPSPGARACLAEHSRGDVEAQLQTLDAHVEMTERPAPRIFETKLAASWNDLPPTIQRLHDSWDIEDFTGTADVTRGAHWLVPLICTVFRFPKEQTQTAVTVTIERRNDLEIWTRRFGKTALTSQIFLSAAAITPPKIFERFGVVTAELDLKAKDSALLFPVKQAWAFGIKLPKWLTPISISREYDASGVFHFDVSLALPGIGQIVRYHGWLKPSA